MNIAKVTRRLAAALVAVAFGVLTMQGAVAQDRPIVLKGITPWIGAYYWSEPFMRFQKMVNQRLKGKVVVSYLGASEVVSPFEQFEALRNGVVDAILGAASYYTGQVPEASAVLYAKLPPTELRKNGYYDLMRKLHLEKGNVIYLANVGGGVDRAFRIFTNVKLDKPDFSGMKVRVTPVYVELVKALGGTPIVMKPSEVYTAMERKVVDAFGWSYGGITDFGWQEVTKYVIDHPFYSANTSILLNADTWNNLTKEEQDTLEGIGRDLEVWADTYMAKQNLKEDVLLKGAGLGFIKFSEADGKKFIATAYDEGWKAFIAKHPKIGPKLKALSE